MSNNTKLSWKEIEMSYKNNSRDVKTVPLKGIGIWFYVYEDNGDIYVEGARQHLNSSRINGRRKIKKEKFDKMLSLYYRRKKGETVYQEAHSITYNQVYWYGIFADMGM